MKIKILVITATLCLFFTFLSITSYGITIKDLCTGQAQDSYEKGFISQDELKIFKTESNIDILTVDYGDFDIYYAYDLNMLDILNVVPDGYKLGEKATNAEADTMILNLFNKNMDINNKILNPNDLITYEGYLSLLLENFGYIKGIDYTSDTMEKITKGIGLSQGVFKEDSFLISDMIRLSRNALDVKFNNSETKLREKLKSEGKISKEADALFEDHLFERQFPEYRDLTSKVMWEYSRKYDFVYFSNFRSGPAPISKSYSWPDNPDIELDNAGRMRIGKTISSVKENQPKYRI